MNPKNKRAQRLARLLDLKQQFALKKALDSQKSVLQFQAQNERLSQYQQEAALQLTHHKNGFLHKNLWHHYNLLSEMKETIAEQARLKQQEYEQRKEKFLSAKQIYDAILKKV